MKYINKTTLLIFALFLLVAGVILLALTGRNPERPQNKTIVIPTPVSVINKTTIPKTIPTIPQSLGGGVDLKSPKIIASEKEIEKLQTFLPYDINIQLSTGLPVEILIPSQDLQNNAWTLKAQIFGINYNTSPEQSDYAMMRHSFIEASGFIFKWVKDSGADPGKIYFIWGDRAYIQNIAEKWLNNQ